MPSTTLASPAIPEEKFTTFMLKDDPLTYKLLMDYNQVCDAEIASGCNLMQALASGSINAAQTRAVLYACLKTAHPLVLLKEAGDLLTREYPVVLEALGIVITEWRQAGLAEEELPEQVDLEAVAAIEDAAKAATTQVGA